ncbi:hypothetical protein ACFL2V_11415 [Pseudomonadota bacterium]
MLSQILRVLGKISFVCTLMLVPAIGSASTILLGSDYFETELAIFPGLGVLEGVPIGPGDTDTIVERQQDCELDLSVNGSNCTIDIELVALSLVSASNPNILVREDASQVSGGQMTIFSDGSGEAGTFDSFFDVFFEVSFDAGNSWLDPDLAFNMPVNGMRLQSFGSEWGIEPTGLLVDGLVGDQAANRHTNKGADQFDFFVKKIEEEHPSGAKHNVVPVSAPPVSLLILFGMLVMPLVAYQRYGGRNRAVS